MAETPEKKEIPIAEAIPEPTPSAPALPQTASEIPLIALFGAMSVSLAVILKKLVS
jgi:hypothetical protein